MPTSEQITALQRLASKRCGVFTRKEALAHGWSVVEVERLVRSGAWVTCGWGALGVAQGEPSLHDHARCCWGRLLRVRGDVVVSHASAGYLFELLYIEAPATPTLTRALAGARAALTESAQPGYLRSIASRPLASPRRAVRGPWST